MHRRPVPGSAIAAFACLILALSASSSHAIFSVTEPWVRAAPDGRNAEAFMKLRSSDAVTLVAVDSFAARAVTIQFPEAKRAPAQLELPANSLVELKPQDTRIRMTGLTRKLKFGEYVPLTLIVRSADGREQKFFVNAEVRHRSPTEDELNPHGHDGHKHRK